jgi:hypothetical protein
MKRIFLIGLVMLAAGLNSIAQAPDVKDERAQVIALVKEVRTQQGQILANQDKIDSKMAEVAEAVRLARIFSSRGR